MAKDGRGSAWGPLRTGTILMALCLSLLMAGCGGRPVPRRHVETSSGAVLIEGDVWADNWFALYLGDKLLVEDSVPITTERSFNAESFSFRADYPLVLNFVVKDFKEDDSGLEYIGTPKQQMGDGGIIAQFRDAATGKPIAVTDGSWSCKVIHRGPLDDSCERESHPVAGQAPCEFIAIDEPIGWKRLDFDDSGWDRATVYAESDVRPKDGYYQINWHPSAKLIWGADLKKDNTILLRLVIHSP
jgi:hypothetical protein